ncbi:uncharacterized protein YfaQ (DUF2300 family) [Serratia fonticola]|uniref:Uncharacterized protein YfaQ (DUF2300 family) n=1 Tax=Serratia fonticola TaxID=47917 RepID=A0A542CYQ8_SERFO|nr:DUF2300 domain-containing protein [Serratia fonticola]TQI82009.1 uncharacterized protein YfaQ (DUF2300 family) [Serratia fonticola]TQI95968.1 uncharacterized protein YfaQ (DUF2300 family) [Serratia fonticola]TVZ70465.1 uncharacterized protein YfaQ (DUF2300 family) [Serratia fonticola]
MMRRWWWLLILPAFAFGAEPGLQVALRQGQENQLLILSQDRQLAQHPLPATLTTPLGSLWKLLVYAYLVDTQQHEADYLCNGSQPQEEIYCCEVGKKVTRDRALVQSCGLYFSPARLQLDPQQWADYWQRRQSPGWLQDLQQLQPDKRIPVAELLDILSTLPGQQQARKVLLDVLLPTESKLIGALGSRLRIKTWSWRDEHDHEMRQGGFAGWLIDGTPVWAQGPGTSKTVLQNYASVLNTVLPQAQPVDPLGCVVVKMFDRYPIVAVRRSGEQQPVKAGGLRGRYQVEFSKGNRLDIESQGELFLRAEQGQLTLTARLEREEYVARVLQREAAAQPREAAKALAVAIRSYLLQNATREEACLTIADSSASQRVAPEPATAAAREVAAWSSDLVLAGAPVTYHLDQAATNRLSWQQAVSQAQQGMRYDAILAHAYPRANLGRWDKPEVLCQAMPEAEGWLIAQQKRWREILNSQPGYATLRQFTVCRLLSGKPHVDRMYNRIYVRDFYSLQDRLDLTHEYLHLAFAAHPNGQDEEYVEQLARHLLLE